MIEPPDQEAPTPKARRDPRPIERPRALHAAVLDRLRDMIVEGDIAVGDRLHEIDLAAKLQVSRTPLREALKLLATEGLVELLPGRGARVSALTPEAVGELFEVISGLERLAGELAAARMSKRDFERLKRMHDRMAEHFAAKNRHDYFALNHEIHVAIVAAAKNANLAAVHASLMAKARRGRYAALASDDRWREAMGEHEALMAALADRDAQRAGEILSRHDQRTGETTMQLLSRKAASQAAGGVVGGPPTALAG
jgi:DNA-binding GntR family transcriptional regulator